MFEPLERAGKVLGYQLKRGRHFYFFGTRHLPRKDFHEVFPDYDFCFLNQVHGAEVVVAEPAQVLSADAHFTSVPGRALVAASADCLPLLFSSGDQVCAVHAGWRGMAKNIIQAVSSQISPPNFVALGPHILAPSFEVGLDVAKLLESTASESERKALVRPSANPEKVFFDLKALAHAQLQACFGSQLTVAECCLDTKTDLSLHSFRRDREKAERQYSFVVIAF
jgi:YfiH family protein